MSRLLGLAFFLIFCTRAGAQDRLSLAQFLAKVESQNLDLKIEAKKSEVAAAKSGGLAIPPPMVGVTQMKEVTGNKANGFEVSQTIPFPTKFLYDKSARNYEADSQEETRLARANEILAKAKLVYSSLWASQEKLGLLNEKKSILENHNKLSRSSARSDSYAGVHVLKAESERDLLENEILSAEQNLREIQAEASLMVSGDLSEAKILAEEPPLSKIPELASTSTSHQIKAATLSLESFSARKAEAVSSWFPDLTFRFKQMSETSMATGYKEIMVGVTLPFLFFWEPRSMASKAGAERSLAEYELEKQKRSAEAEKSVLIGRAESLRNRIGVLTTKLIPRAEKRMRLVHNLAPRDMETLQDHRETMEALPDLKMSALELRLEYELAVSSLEKYLTHATDRKEP